MKKIISLTLLFFWLSQTVIASPFDILRDYYPDFIISDVTQDYNSKDIYMKVCNVWWDLNSFWTLLLWIKKDTYSYWTTIQNFNLKSRMCWNYKVASAKDIWIWTNWYYYMTFWISVKWDKTEQNKDNNIIKKTIYITTSTTINNINFCNYSPYNSCQPQIYQNYQDSSWHISISRPSWWNIYNDSLEFSADFYINPRNVNYIDINIYKKNWYFNDLYKTERIYYIFNNYYRNPFTIKKNFSTSSWKSWQYYLQVKVIWFNSQENITKQSSSFTVWSFSNKPDFVVYDIKQNSIDYLNFKICNDWWKNNNQYDFATKIYNINQGKTITMNNSIELDSWDCRDYSIPLDRIWIYSNWYYNIKIETDTYNEISEKNENNNSLRENFYLKR